MSYVCSFRMEKKKKTCSLTRFTPMLLDEFLIILYVWIFTILARLVLGFAADRLCKHKILWYPFWGFPRGKMGELGFNPSHINHCLTRNSLVNVNEIKFWKNLLKRKFKWKQKDNGKCIHRKTISRDVHLGNYQQMDLLIWRVIFSVTYCSVLRFLS